jgi:signal transduction histidine kinase
MEPPLIVLVDDLPQNIKLLGQLLKGKGYRILALTDSKKAFNAVNKNQPALVLLDIMMPGMDGFEVCKALKANPNTADIPVIFLTAKTESYDIVKGFEIGAVDYVTKPFNNHELLMRVQTQIALQNAIKKAEKANAAKSDFLANISHDIRSPMNGIMNVVDLLLKSELTPEQTDFLHMAKQAGTSLLCLINDLLDLSKIEAGQLVLDNIYFDLRELLENISDIYAIEAYKKGLQYACIISSDLQTNVLGDPNRLRQIINNLINNAIKFTHKGEVSISVTQQSDDTLHFAVQDTGKGIAVHKMNQLFKPYDQLEASTARKYGGTGLGLSISRQLVNLMKGKTHVESKEGEGSIFSFTAMLPKHENKTNPILQCSPDKVHMLIIHQHKKSRQALANLLKTFHFNCHEASDTITTLSLLNDFSTQQINCQFVFIDKETYDEEILSIYSSIKGHSTIHLARWVVLKKIGSDLNDDVFDDVLNQPVHYLSLLTCLKKIYEFQDKQDQMIHLESSLKDILVIDDEVINRIIAKNFLSVIGYTPDIVDNFEDALFKMANKDYLAVMTDLYMPDMSAIELINIIRNPKSQVKNHDIRIIVVSASDMKSDKELCMEAGANAFLTKPYTQEQLKHVIVMQ